MINTGMAWKLEGAIGRECMEAIYAGYAMLGEAGLRDFYGNYVPSRYEVEDGTPGSPGYYTKTMEDAEIPIGIRQEV
jgi:hypothetical protein